MQTFFEALSDGGWGLEKDLMYVRKNFGDIEICFEPLLFDKQFYLAIYDKNLNILCPKIPIKPGKL